MAALRIEEGYHIVYRSLAREPGDGNSKRAFGTMKDVFMLAFALGVTQGIRTQLHGGRDLFQQEMLKERDWDLLRCVALSDNPGLISEIDDESQLLRLAQEYANTGIRALQQRLQPAQVEQSVANAVLAVLDTIGSS